MRSLTNRTRAAWLSFALALGCAGSAPARAANILFDASHHEMAGNADWVIDADTSDLLLPAFPCSGSTLESRPQRVPTPPASGITAATSENYWKGGVSAWAVDLVKAGHSVESLPDGVAITYGNGGNPQDLSHYQLFIVVEPQTPFSAAEKSAILAFVAAGGGLFMVADHETSDRDCDNFDAPHVWNDLTGATSASSAGLFGFWFRVDGLENQGSEDWFDEGIDNNTQTDPTDPVIHGPFGSGAGGLGLFGSTSMELNPANNATVRAHVWRVGQAHNGSRVTFATAQYGNGRVAAIGDSSPADDSTGDTNDSLHPGWDLATGGVANREIHLNASHWLMNLPPPPPDTTPPAPVTDLTALPTSSATVQLSWTATGDDGSVGIASAYDIRISPRRILTEAEFAAAASVASPPAPVGPGGAQLMTVSGLAADTPYWFAIKVLDEVANASSLSNTDGGVTAPTGSGPPGANHLVISQVQTSGDGGTPADDEFVELYNPTSAAIALSGLSVQYKAATGTTYLPFVFPSVSIPSHGWYLVARSVYNGPAAADATNTAFQLSATGGNLFLVAATAALPTSSCSTSATIIDKVAWGTGNCPETTVVAAPAANASILRKPGGISGNGTDSDNNMSDFQAQSPATPRNRFSTPASSGPSLGLVGNSLYLDAIVGGVGHARLDWANAAGATGYRVYRGSAPGFMNGFPAPWATPAASTTNDTEPPPPPGGAYFYLVRATDGTSESSN